MLKSETMNKVKTIDDIRDHDLLAAKMAKTDKIVTNMKLRIIRQIITVETIMERSW